MCGLDVFLLSTRPYPILFSLSIAGKEGITSTLSIKLIHCLYDYLVTVAVAVAVVAMDLSSLLAALPAVQQQTHLQSLQNESYRLESLRLPHY